MRQINYVYFNATAASNGNDDGGMYRADSLLAMNSTAAALL